MRDVFRSMIDSTGWRDMVDNFIARLRKQAQNCNFNDPNVVIRDQKSSINVDLRF